MAAAGAVALGCTHVAPFKLILSFSQKAFNFLKGIATQTETFKKLMELVMMPFMLMFTLLFAPVLMALAPLLATVIQSIASKQDAIMAVGAKIGLVIEKFFDDKMIETYIALIDQVSRSYRLVCRCRKGTISPLVTPYLRQLYSPLRKSCRQVLVAKSLDGRTGQRELESSTSSVNNDIGFRLSCRRNSFRSLNHFAPTAMIRRPADAVRLAGYSKGSGRTEVNRMKAHNINSFLNVSVLDIQVKCLDTYNGAT